MNLGTSTTPRGARSSPPRLRAQVRLALLAVVAFVCGAGLGALAVHQIAAPHPVSPEEGNPASTGLSPATQAVLHHLGTPVAIRFYALLDPASVSEADRAFAAQADGLMSTFQQAAGGKLQVSRYTALAEDAPAAATNGLQPFNLDKGAACFLGMTVTAHGRRETLARLRPAWAAALEADVARAIERVAEAPAAPNPLAAAIPPDPATVAAVKRTIPDLAAVSAEEGARRLRTAALDEFKAVAKEMEDQVKTAQARLTQAQQSGSAADQQAAMNQLQQVQAAQAERLRAIAARAQAEVQAFQQLKAGAR